MPLFIQHKIPELKMLCKKHKIKDLWLFGSALSKEDFGKESDVDVLYELDRPQITDEEYLDNFWGFWDALESLFERKVDLVHYASIKNPYFKEEVDETKYLVYGQEGEKVPV